MPDDRLRQLFLSATAAYERGDFVHAESDFQTIQEEFPRNPDALYMLGLIAQQRKLYHDAVGLIRHAIDLDPNKSDYYVTLAGTWWTLGRFRLSAEAWKGVLQVEPDNAKAALYTAHALWEVRDVDATVEYCRLAITLNGNLEKAHALLAIALAAQGDPEGSLDSYRQALRLNPDWPTVRSKFLFGLEQQDSYDPQIAYAELAEYNRLHALPLKHLIKPHLFLGSSKQALRIGWVSPDFRVNVVGRCMFPVFQAFDRANFEHFCYSSLPEPDEMTNAIRAAAGPWRDISAMDDDAAADLVRSDQLDVLVDLTLHTDHNRLLLFARKPAPVQATYLSYPGSTGLDAIDYRISNPRLDPPGSDLSRYHERTIMLSGSYFCYRPLAAGAQILPLPALRNGHVTFGCLNNSTKLSSAAFDVWAEILRTVPGSRLLLLVTSAVFQTKIRDRFRRAAINPARIEFVTHQGWPDYIATYNRIDIALNTFAHGAGVTACDALWMGVPIVTLIGDSAVPRMCYSILYDIGHTEWAAETREQYKQIAIVLARALPKLADIRSQLRSEIESSPLMDAAAVARDLERVLKEAASRR